MPRKIVACEIGPYPKGMFDVEMPKVRVTFDDGVEMELFEFFPDELSFFPSDFVGKTEDDARAFRHAKDVAYLRS